MFVYFLATITLTYVCGLVYFLFRAISFRSKFSKVLISCIFKVHTHMYSFQMIFYVSIFGALNDKYHTPIFSPLALLGVSNVLFSGSVLETTCQHWVSGA